MDGIGSGILLVRENMSLVVIPNLSADRQQLLCRCMLARGHVGNRNSHALRYLLPIKFGWRYRLGP